MTLSDLSVKRPVFAAVAAIVLVVIGVAAFFTLPVRELPSVDPPVVSIETDYTGASAEVVEQRITQVIEQQVAGIQGIDVVNSSSRDGISRITITFTLDRDLDGAANDVRDAVSHVANLLPLDAKPPQIAKASADSQSILFLGFTSSKLSKLQLADYANQYLVARLSTIPGVGQVRLGGAGLYSMRIWLDADAMAARGITVDDVQNALNAQNVELPAGALESTAKDYTIRVNRQYNTPAEFAALPIVAGRGAGGTTSLATAPSPTTAAAVTATARGANSQMPVTGMQLPNAQSGSTYIVRVGDIARIEEGADDRRNYFQVNGQNEVGLSVTGQAQANNLQISRDTHKMIEDINKQLPPGTRLEVIVDYSVFTSEAIKEVWITMGIALALVALVNFVFLGSWRAAVIPAVVAPICIVSTFSVLAVLGYSINLLSLLALVLAIGLVVDDAIVVVENVQRHVDEGEPPAVAAQRGAKQVFFAVVATTVVLIAVFAPLFILPGFIGRLFRELSVTVAAAVFFSALMALSLSPMLGSKLLRPASGEGWLARMVDGATDAMKRSYAASLQMILGGKFTTLLTCVVVLVLALAAGGLFLALPKELVPGEDRGRVDLNIQGPEGAGYDYTVHAVQQAEPNFVALRKKGVLTRYLFSVPRFGNGQYNTGFGTTVMSDWRTRKITADELAGQLNKQLGSITSARIIASVRGPFQRGGQGGSGSNVDFIVSGNDYEEINKWIQPILKAAQANPGLARPRIDYEPTSPRLLVNIDHDKAASLGVSAQEIGSALQVMFGSKQVTNYVKNGQEYYVTLQTDLDKRRTVDDLDKLSVRTASGSLVPLSNVVKTEVRGDTPDRERVDRIRSITLTQELNPGYTVGAAVKFYQDQAAKQPPGMLIKWGGQAKDYLQASDAIAWAFGGALLLVFLALAAQFESWIHPAVIMLTVPLAALGGLFGILIAGSSINTYSEIGLIILVGIAAKNGILIVEFANQLRDEGRSVHDAVIEAAALRLRPIIMTSISAAFGALPLILAAGPGAGSRKTIGVAVFTGAIFSTLLTLFVVPVFYNLLARFTRSPEWTAKEIERYEEEERGGGHPEPSPAE
jgi:multidrug efflux pump